jgi:hypothetical protein
MSFLLTQEPMVWPFLWLSFLIGYLSGSVPYGLILSGLMGLGDIRKAGSGNIGATNVLRVGGKKLAIATLLLDALKGAIPVLVAKEIHMDYAVLAALGAFLGHLFPIWLKFKGGKGGSDSAWYLLRFFAVSWPCSCRHLAGDGYCDEVFVFLRPDGLCGGTLPGVFPGGLFAGHHCHVYHFGFCLDKAPR